MSFVPVEIPTDSADAHQHHEKKRKRTSSVCTNCKRRKIKCDRQLPCSNCVKSRRVSSCVYDDGKSTDVVSNVDNNVLSGKLTSRPYEDSARNPIRFDDKSTKKRQKISNQTNGSNGNNMTQDQVTISLTELNMLKERLQNIESSIGRSNSSSTTATTSAPVAPPAPPAPPAPTTNSYLPPPISFSPWSPPVNNDSILLPPQNRLATNYNVSNTRGSSPSIQLPPIAFRDQQQQQQQQQPPPPQPQQPPQPQLQHTPISRNQSIPSTLSYSSISNPSENGYFKTPESSISEKAPVSESTIGINPYLNDAETMNFYEGYTPICVKDYRRINHGPFAWSSYMRKDKPLSLLWEHICVMKEEKNEAGSSQTFIFSKKNHEITQENTNLVTSESNESEAKFKKKELESFGYSDIVPYDALKKNLKKEINKVSLPVGLTIYEEHVNMELQLVDRIHLLLPKKKVIWKLLDRFFTLLYPFMPLVDEIDFRASITKMIGPKSYEDTKVEGVKVENRLDLAILGTFLLILRLSYLSLFCNKESVNEMRATTTDPSEEAQTIKYLIQNPVGISLVDAATACLNQFDLFRKTSMPVLQCAFFLHYYHVFAPEDGDDGDGGDSFTLHAMLVQMSYSLGLNRDPDNFPDILNDKRQNHLGRKFWYLLMLADTHNAYAFGTPKSICDSYHDTKLPFIEDGGENLIDKDFDRFITGLFFPGYNALYSRMSKMLTLILDVSGRVKMSELTKQLSEFELGMKEKYGSLDDLLTITTENTHVFARNMPVKLYISLSSFLVSVYFHIYLHYEKKDVNLSFFYLKKIIQIAAMDVMPHYFELLGNSEVLCDMFINPKLIQIIHKLNQLNLAMIIRVNFSIYYLKSQENHALNCSNDEKYYSYYKELCKFSSCLTRCAEVGVSAVSKLSNRYYYAWKVTKANNYLLKVITTMDFYDSHVKDSGKLMMPNYTIEQIQELGSMCESALSKLGKTKMVGDEFCSNVNYKNYKCNYMSATSSDSNQTPSDKEDITRYTKDFSLDFDLVNNEEIDKIWLQMLSMKNDQQQQQQQQQQGPAPYNTPGVLNNYGYDAMDGASFDMLIDLDNLWQ
ncbi:Heme-responsive zinc finger transcription factor, putative [Candida maltosa Xu316]|uniref:Heme-responsive zinc finger transcription factor, putative n=1 Tax=Candida maltosa (strain Xu316) TaxID=1245528 RepID=M3JUK0_CANMX|nr:Heme-responsive zinc finger transcription factor, putative [Candida maltosa Xu316]